jgi:arginyl-tRNA--protein-N-Asp/Glu arginylyltransferase
VEYWEELWDAADPQWRSDPPQRVSLSPGFCDYLPGRMWSLEMITHPRVDRLMLLGGQRFGYAYCVTGCARCRACVPARIRIEGFEFTRSQRRTLRHNQDLSLTVAPVSYTPEKFQLLVRFVETKFGKRTDWLRTETDKVQYYLSFHLHNQAHSREVQYRDGDRLVGVSIVDMGQQGLYSHYFFYDLLERKRRLGIFSFLQEIAWCQQLGLPYLYIGFLNEQTPALSYKGQFANLEVLRPGQGWVPYQPKQTLSKPT